MIKKNAWRRVSDGILAAVLAVFLLSASVILTLMCRPLYYHDIKSLHIAESSGYPENEIRENYDTLIDYNLYPAQKELVFPTLPMSEEGRIHFQEVKKIFQFFLRMLIGSAMLLCIGSIWKLRCREAGYLLGAGILVPAVLLAIGAAIALNWEGTFVLFHKMVFQNDYWLFDPVTDPVITILPDTFFLHCAVMILALAAIGSAACLILYRAVSRKRT